MKRALSFSLALFLAACSGPREATGPSGPNPPPDRGPAPPAYETFDPTGYDAEPAPPAQIVQHDVPARLMRGRVVVPGQDVPRGPRTVEGFRIQVFTTEDRAAAERVREEAEGWWSSARMQPGAPSAPFEVDIEYQQPYYRVRLFGFEYRGEADAALPFVRRRYDTAFIVPDDVTIND
ncbi:MAG TPA: SPOR domain-containing protein [Rubricoccaceae bacterium]|nr:SPOR domain-containing protein [Rubricoccaceae bacterium]